MRSRISSVVHNMAGWGWWRLLYFVFKCWTIITIQLSTYQLRLIKLALPQFPDDRVTPKTIRTCIIEHNEDISMCRFPYFKKNLG